MSLNKSIPITSDIENLADFSQNNEWRFRFPNSADFNFNYYKLLEENPNGIATNKKPDIQIAIIGAGIAGMLAARELFRCGFQKIDIYEPSGRIGGRLWSEPTPDSQTSYEMGAMRMPFFDKIGSKNCLLDYYRNAFNIEVQDFPNPGATVDTGIYINDGYGPDMNKPYKEPTMDVWKDPASGTLPPAGFQAVHAKFIQWHKRMFITIQAEYNLGDDVWTAFWQKIVNHYWSINFRDLVFMDAIAENHWEDEAELGNFGGLGMTEEESKLFYVIGMGDGGWGAFYDISALYPIRTIMFGFSTNLKLIKGISCPQYCPIPGDTESENLDQLARPLFRGMQSFPEAMYYAPVESLNPEVNSKSLYTAPGVRLLINQAATKMTCLPNSNHSIEIESSRGIKKTYQHIILTPQTWAVQRSIQFVDFSPKQWPFQIRSSMKLAHSIASSKIFFPLRARYWEVCNIPQVIVTDTFLQGIYGYAVNGDSDCPTNPPGALLVSYTWEDDSLKLLAEDKDMLAEASLDRLDKILARTGLPSIRPYIDKNHPPQVFHWSEQPTHRGCAKLYRERTWNDNYHLLRYNQTTSKESNIYLAGESYSVEGGWTEPAMRMAMDAVIRLLINTNTPFNNFDIKNYPDFMDWSPTMRKTVQLVESEPTIL